MPRRLLDRFSHVVVAVKVKDIGDQVERVLVVLYLCIQAREVEPVGQVFFVDFAEVLVAAGRYELAWPSALFAVVLSTQASTTSGARDDRMI